MKRHRILVADNRAEFVNQLRQYLDRNGFQTVGAESPTSARRAIKSASIDLAVLDLRLVDDEDPDDWSGIEIARDTLPQVPKIILTGYPSIRAVREALAPALHDVPPAVDFVSKKEGFNVLLDVVNSALDPIKSAARQRLLATMGASNVLALTVAPEKLGVEDSIARIETLLESDRADLAVPRASAERRAAEMHRYVNVAAWTAAGLIVVALICTALGQIRATTAALVVTLAISGVKRLFEGRARQAQRSVEEGVQQMERISWIHKMIEIASQLDRPKRQHALERILEFMLTESIGARHE